MGSLVGIDTLVGIDNCYKEKIFDAFEQVGNKKRHVKGTGLGLAFVKQVVELHGGNVSVVSKVDKGSFFAIDLPQYCGQIKKGDKKAIHRIRCKC